MLYTKKIKQIYEKIQNKLFYMIPEKWDKLYLYASVFEHLDTYLSGEMYFYYCPKGIIKKNPINVYEIPSKFNIQEEAYMKHINELYENIKELWQEFKKVEHRPWYEITIAIENFRFKIEYNYTDVRNMPYNNIQRHIIWRYLNLYTEFDLYNRKDRKLIEQYLNSGIKEEKELYDEGIYKNSVKNSLEYERTEHTEEETSIVEDLIEGQCEKQKEKIKKNTEKTEKSHKEEKPKVTNQILNNK